MLKNPEKLHQEIIKKYKDKAIDIPINTVEAILTYQALSSQEKGYPKLVTDDKSEDSSSSNPNSKNDKQFALFLITSISIVILLVCIAAWYAKKKKNNEPSEAYI